MNNGSNEKASKAHGAATGSTVSVNAPTTATVVTPTVTSPPTGATATETSAAGPTVVAPVPTPDATTSITGAEAPTPGTPATIEANANLNTVDLPRARVIVAGLAVLRLGKAAVVEIRQPASRGRTRPVGF